MLHITKSAKTYFERKLPKYQNTLRSPVPQIYLPDNPVNHITLTPPFPLPKFAYDRKYVTGGKTQPWPTNQTNCTNCNQ